LSCRGRSLSEPVDAAQDVSEQVSRDGDLGNLECDTVPMAYDLRADHDELLSQCGLRAKHLQAYLNEFVFRFNRRCSRHAAFRSLLAIASTAKPVTYKMLIAPELKG
jgi:hypothetical protein